MDNNDFNTRSKVISLQPTTTLGLRVEVQQDWEQWRTILEKAKVYKHYNARRSRSEMLWPHCMQQRQLVISSGTPICTDCEDKTLIYCIYQHRTELCFRHSTSLVSSSNLSPDQKHLENFEMWCWRRMEKISWTDHVRNEEVLLRVNEQRNILHEIIKRKANWIGHILRRNCLLKQVIEGNIKGQMEVTRKNA